MSELHREMGTALADQPHPFKEIAGVCDVCLGGRFDSRHTEWAAVEQARQTAAGGSVPRVHG